MFPSLDLMQDEEMLSRQYWSFHGSLGRHNCLMTEYLDTMLKIALLKSLNAGGIKITQNLSSASSCAQNSRACALIAKKFWTRYAHGERTRNSGEED